MTRPTDHHGRRDGRRHPDHEGTGFDPASLAVGRRHLRVGGAWVATLVVTGYPHEAHPGWLAPLSGHPGLIDVAAHITPIPPPVAATRLRRQLARLESGRRADADHGRLLDPHVEAATADAYDLSARVARGEARLFTLTLTMTVRAGTAARLDEDIAALAATAASMLIDARPTTYRALNGWTTSLPLGIDRIGDGRILDTDALAAAFPFTNPDLPTPSTTGATGGAAGTGVLYGHNLASQSLLFWDRWGCDNYNSIILGRSGSGKSYLTKLELLRSLYQGVHAHVIDPEDEYTRLAHAVDATVVRPGAPGVRVNPLELPVHVHPETGARTAAPDTLARRGMHLHTVVSVLLGQTLNPDERAVLDTALTTTYRRAGITPDPSTWTRPAPLLADLHTTLTHLAHPTRQPYRANTNDDDPGQNDPGQDDPGQDEAVTGADSTAPGAVGIGAELGAVAATLATRLRPFVHGAFADLFAGPTTHPPTGHLVVWSLRELPDELKPVATLLCLDTIWRHVTHPHDRRRRLIVVDEAWLLMAQPEGAAFLLRAAKAGRKHWAGLTVATQDTADVLGTDLGRAVIANCATQILLRQAPQALDPVTATFHLTAGERAFLLTAARGDALLCAGTERAVFAATASPHEDLLASTTPGQLAHLHPTGPEWITLDPPPQPPAAACAPAPAARASAGHPAPGADTSHGQAPVHHPGDTPDADTPYGGTPYGGTPYGGTPYGDTPYGDTPYGDTPYGAEDDQDIEDRHLAAGDDYDGDDYDGGAYGGGSRDEGVTW